MRWVVACCVAAGCSYSPDRIGLAPDAMVDVDAPPVPPSPFHLYVEATIDGRSNLIVHGTNVTWRHIEFAAPGRENFTNAPTMLDTVAWQPMWPDAPDAENRNCNCMSSTFADLPVGLPAVPSTVTLTHVKGREDDSPRALELPTELNNFTLVIEFDDLGPGGSDVYGANIDVVPL